MILLQEVSWWGFALSGFVLKPDSRIPTMALAYDTATLRPAIHFNEEFLTEKLKSGEVAAVLMHELGHYLQMYFQRRELRDPQRWNAAADGIVNWSVDRDVKNPFDKAWIKGVKLPDQVIRLPNDFPKENLYAEWVYENMDKDESLKKMQEAISQGKMVLVDDHSLWGSFDQVPDEVLKSSVINTIQNAQKMAGVGSAPGGAEEILKLLLQSKVSWRTLLRDFAGQNQRVGSRGTWKRPNRRFGPRQQGKIVKRTGKLAFVIDTSGSMSQDELSQVMTEADYVARILDVWIIDCDTKVQQVYKYRRGINLKCKGRGGTDLNPGLLHADKDLKADMIVCLTDGGLWDPPINTRARQLWIVTEHGTNSMIKDRRHVFMGE